MKKKKRKGAKQERIWFKKYRKEKKGDENLHAPKNRKPTQILKVLKKNNNSANLKQKRKY